MNIDNTRAYSFFTDEIDNNMDYHESLGSNIRKKLNTLYIPHNVLENYYDEEHPDNSQQITNRTGHLSTQWSTETPKFKTENRANKSPKIDPDSYYEFPESNHGNRYIDKIRASRRKKDKNNYIDLLIKYIEEKLPSINDQGLSIIASMITAQNREELENPKSTLKKSVHSTPSKYDNRTIASTQQNEVVNKNSLNPNMYFGNLKFKKLFNFKDSSGEIIKLSIMTYTKKPSVKLALKTKAFWIIFVVQYSMSLINTFVIVNWKLYILKSSVYKVFFCQNPIKKIAGYRCRKR